MSSPDPAEPITAEKGQLPTAQVELEKRGVRFTDPIKPAGGGGRVLFFSDVEGNLLHLVERTADSPVK